MPVAKKRHSDFPTSPRRVYSTRVNGGDAAAGLLVPRHRPTGDPASAEPVGLTIHSQVARNLILARHAVGITQDALAENSGVSRATIAQIERGDNDCRLGTLSELAQALTIHPLLLLLRQSDLVVLGHCLPRPAVERVLALLTGGQVQEMHRLLQSGLQKNLGRIAQAGATAAAAAGLSTQGAAVGAGIGSVLLPGLGTAVGAIFGEALSRRPGAATFALENGEGI